MTARVALALALSLWAPAAARAAAPLEAARLEGAQALAPGQGGVVLLLVVGNHDERNAEPWDALLERVGDGAYVRLAAATAPAVHALDAGRYLLTSARAQDGRVLNGIADGERWFEVVAGRIVYAGRWQVESAVSASMAGRIRAEVSFPPEPLAPLAADPASPLARLGFWLAPVGAPAKPLARR